MCHGSNPAIPNSDSASKGDDGGIPSSERRPDSRSGDTSISHLRVGDRIIESVGIRGEGLSALDHLPGQGEGD